jgi:hypothetical protein
MPPHVIKLNPGLVAAYTNVPRLTTIEFDDAPTGTVIDSRYASLSASFKSITTSPPSQWSAFAVNSIGGPHTSPNGVSILPTSATFDAAHGGVEVTFATLQFGVAIWAKPYLSLEPLSEYDNRPFLEAFDAHGGFLTASRFPFGWADPTFSSWQRLAVLSSADPNNRAPKIKSVVFSSESEGANPVYAEFDSLEFWVFEPFRFTLPKVLP